MPDENLTSYKYRHSEFILASALLPGILGLIVLGIYEKQHFSFYFINPLVYICFCLLVCWAGVAFIPNNYWSYDVIAGRPALIVGQLFIFLGVIYLLLFNIAPPIFGLALGSQLFTGPLILLGMSFRYGTRVDRNNSPNFFSGP